MMPMQEGGAEPWGIISELQRDFNVKQIEITADQIPDDIQVLVVIHPKTIPESAEFAIDQFVLPGGRSWPFSIPVGA